MAVELAAEALNKSDQNWPRNKLNVGKVINVFGGVEVSNSY